MNLHFPLFLARGTAQNIWRFYFLRFDDELYEIYILDVEFHIEAWFFSLFFLCSFRRNGLGHEDLKILFHPHYTTRPYFLVVPKMEIFASWKCPLNLSWMCSESTIFFPQWIGMLLHLIDGRYTPKHAKIRVWGISSFMFQSLLQPCYFMLN